MMTDVQFLQGQYVDGLRSPVVILPPVTPGKRPYDDEFTVSFEIICISYQQAR
jgi:hypothetical protein